MADTAWKSAVDLVSEIASGKTSSEAVLDTCLERIEAHNGAINAVVALDADAARARARAADEAAARGESWGPLHGLPMTVKDTFEVVGMACTAGAPELAEHRPNRHATSVERLIEAGAIVYGKTNTPIWAGDLQTYNDVFGTTNNPWDTSRAPGGSSGGSAAAVASGFSALELGSDIGGSIRNPAHFCGVAGHKPSFGIVPIRGHIPGPPGHLTGADIGVAGPLARTVADLELALDVMAGPDEFDGPGWRLDLAGPRHEALKDYRVAVWADDPACETDTEIADLITAAGQRLAEQGARVSDTARPVIDMTESHEIYYMLLAAELGGGLPEGLRERLRKAPPAEDDRSHHAIFSRGAVIDHAGWQVWNEKRAQLREAWRQFFGDWDVLLCPVMPRAAIPHDQSRDFQGRTVEINGKTRDYVDMIIWCGMTCGVYLPATVIPIGQTSEGLPVGMQIVANFLEDRTALHVARQLEQLLGGFTPPPMFR
ncbi:MAG: amidase [Minwuia sp.]|uniref:amidase n=1 Tax=Minwuia sp. TaxID=2493630 RepID=UPI003A840297